MKAAIYPGSFDPPTYGHLDIINRAAALTDRLVVTVTRNSVKDALFTVDERIELLRQAVGAAGVENVEIVACDGLVSSLSKKLDIHVMIKGVRDFGDWTAETQMALLNKNADPLLETILLPAAAHLTHISSAALKEFARYNGSLQTFAPDFISHAVLDKIRRQD